MQKTNATRRPAFSLLELMAATTIMATIMAASFALVRTSNNAWRKHRDDSAQRQGAISAVQHVVRRVRQAGRVTSITPAANTAGALTVLMPDGTTSMWSRNSSTNQLLYGTTSANNLLANGITETTFTAYKADGATTTTQVDLIHAVRCQVKFVVTRPGGNVTETVSSTAFLRSW